MKGLGASVAGAAALGSNHGAAGTVSADGALEIGIAASVIGGPALLAGWALREYNVIGSDAPPEGLTSDALHQQAYQTATTRKSTNASTFVDNANLLDGVKNNAYTEAKIAAIEELNTGSSESAVLDAANAAIDDYHTTVEKNLLKSWNESVNELEAMVSSLEAHPDITVRQLGFTGDGNGYISSASTSEYEEHQFPTEEHTFADGTTLTLKSVKLNTEYDGQTWSPVSKNGVSPGDWNAAHSYAAFFNFNDGTPVWLDYDDWNAVYSEMSTKFQNVRDGISTWVTNVYGDVQSGSIEISELVTPRERAAMMSEEEGMSQAIADLVALNVPVDPDREATITIDDTGATLRGTFGLSDSSDGPIESGTTYDPSTFAGDAYFTADMSLVEGDWEAYETGVDGGTITITSEPYEGTAIEVTTTADETVTVPAADWSDNGDGTWLYDASGDLETNITEVSSARFHATATETQYETLRLDSTFTVDELTDSDGESVEQTSFSSSEPQDDSNYITQDEWDQLEQQNQELIEKYENSQTGGGGAIDWSGFSLGGIPGEYVVGGVAVVAGYLGITS